MCLPSGDAAVSLARGNVAAIPKVVGTMAIRGALAGSGLYLAGARGKNLLVYTVAAAAAIEVGVVAWAAYRVWKDSQVTPT